MNRNERARHRLKAALDARYGTQLETARALSVQPSYISMLLRGQRIPSFPLAVQLAKAAGLSLEVVAEATIGEAA